MSRFVRKGFQVGVLGIVGASAVLLVLFMAPVGQGSAPATSEHGGRFVGGETGLPLPRFVSVDARRANVRSGPGTDYPILWTFVRPNVPLEIINEFGNWRRIRDWTGTRGWIHHALLSSARAAITSPWSKKGELIGLYREPLLSAAEVARIQPKTFLNVESCDGRWCDVDVQTYRGYVQQSKLWGVYPNETFPHG